MTEVNILIAFAAGVLGFISPCVLPLIPGYISFVSGVSLQELQIGGGKVVPRVLLASLLFVLGFSLVFTAMGASASLVGSFIISNRSLLGRIGGILVILLGLTVLGVIKVPALYRERRLHLSSQPFGLIGAIPVGMAFGFAWIPCVGPVLTAVLTMAATLNTVRQGSILLFSYAMGLGIPFLLTALLLTLSIDFLGWARRYSRYVTAASGVFLLVMGLAMAFDVIYQLNTWIIRLFPFRPPI
ncbi:MAG: cytochrome c biogenesis protein CcdA [Armatimonadota bacterium]|nr:cytochrome c biogenesis protein CcdA [Armatimonadota bacterium]MDR5704122.1 cytochrome c biogenesis protein CcdA [Armatimonadota bacterium]